MSDSGFRLRYLGDPVLTTPCRRVASIEEIPAGLAVAMEEIATGQHRALPDGRSGAGLAANQAGACVAICIVRVHGAWITMVNPHLVHRTPAMEWVNEGCLSIPGFQTRKRRHLGVTVEYVSEALTVPHRLTLSGVESQCVQHELDHLAGVLIIDGLSRQQRRQADRAIEKAVRA